MSSGSNPGRPRRWARPGPGGGACLLPLFWLILALVAGCGPARPAAPVRDARADALEARVDSLRARGDFVAARDVAERLRRHLATAQSPEWRRADAARLDATLARVAALPAAARRDVAEADSLTPVITHFLNDDENYVAATNAATRQLILRSRRLGADHPEVAATLDLLGQVAYKAGELEPCQEYLERALALRRGQLGARHPGVAETLHHQGILLKALQRFAESESIYRSALAIEEATLPADDPAQASLLESMGSLLRLRRRFPEAESLYARALEIRRRVAGPGSLAVAENRMWAGYNSISGGHAERAEAQLQEARGIFRERGMDLSHQMSDVTWLLGNLASLRGDCRAAADYWRYSFSCRNEPDLHHPLGFGLSRLRGLYPPWIDALAEQGRNEEAWAEFARGSGQAAQVLMDFNRVRSAHPAESARLDSLRARALMLRHELRRRQPTTTATLPLEVAEVVGAPGDHGPIDSLRVELARADAARMRLEELMLAREPRLAGAAPSPVDVQALLRPDQALVGWLEVNLGVTDGLRRHRVWAFVLRRDAPLRWIPLAAPPNFRATEEWGGSTRMTYFSVLRASQWPHRVGADAQLDSLGRINGKKFLEPLLPGLGGVRELVIVNGGSIPLPYYRFLPECALDAAGRPYAERFSFSYVLAPDIFVQLQRRARAAGGRRGAIVAVADPTGPAVAPHEVEGLAALEPARFLEPAGAALVSPSLLRDAVSGRPEALRRLPRLLQAREEALRVASFYPGASLLLGPAATGGRLDVTLREAGRVGIVHLATHALVDGDDPSRSALVLAPGAFDGAEARDQAHFDDGLWTAQDVLLGRQYDIDLVTLSACQSSRGAMGQNGEEIGFSQAFLAAGARSLLMSRWKVDDQATALLMGRFYESLSGARGAAPGAPRGRGMSKARALQEAQLWLRGWRSPDGRVPFAHPVYWAGFVLMGNGD